MKHPRGSAVHCGGRGHLRVIIAACDQHTQLTSSMLQNCGAWRIWWGLYVLHAQRAGVRTNVVGRRLTEVSPLTPISGRGG